MIETKKFSTKPVVGCLPGISSVRSLPVLELPVTSRSVSPPVDSIKSQLQALDPDHDHIVVPCGFGVAYVSVPRHQEKR